LAQKSTLHKDLTKYNKANGITPITTHVQATHPKLFAMKKQQFSAVIEYVIVHV
jgi:hypothetical protein